MGEGFWLQLLICFSLYSYTFRREQLLDAVEKHSVVVGKDKVGVVSNNEMKIVNQCDVSSFFIRPTVHVQ